MLTEADKERIRFEEIYRLEVRRQLEVQISTPTRKMKLLQFLNTALGLWLLSAIFISGFSGIITLALQRVSASKAQRNAIEHLDTEISYRLSQVLQRLFTLSVARDRRPGDVGATVELLYEPGTKIRSLYPEFQGRGVVPLVAELREEISPGRDRDEIDKLLGHLTTAAPASEIGSDPRESASGILRSFVLSRWKQFPFYQVRCKPSDPFC